MNSIFNLHRTLLRRHLFLQQLKITKITIKKFPTSSIFDNKDGLASYNFFFLFFKILNNYFLKY
jgi:hypothetical protein